MESEKSESISWIDGDESAKAMLDRVLTWRPLFTLPPPLHRIPLRVGNVVEIAGPSPSSKTLILSQAAVSCILPKEWDGVHYGGLGHSVIYIDLDCRFDVSRLVEMLRYRIKEANGLSSTAYDEEVIKVSLRRFSYIRCYDSLELLATLKTLNYRLEKETESHGINGHLLIVDSIGSFYWVDRASTSFPLQGNNRKCLSLQNVWELVVQDLKKLLLMHPMLVIASKATIFGTPGNEVRRDRKRGPSSTDPGSRSESPFCHEYMPSVWQSFVTHRISVRSSDDHTAIAKSHENDSVYVSEWFLPGLNFLDKFAVRDAGVFIIR